MHVPFKLDQDNMAVLLDAHDILMTWNTDEPLVLQRICNKLFSSFPFDLVWGGLIGPDSRLSVAGAAGSGAEHIDGITLECAGISANAQLRQCLDTLSPIYLADGLIALNTRLFNASPLESRPLPVNIYPLTLENRCLGVLGVSVKNRCQLNQHEHVLLQLTAQHTGFSLGLLRSFVAKDSAQNSLKHSAAVFDNAPEDIAVTGSAGSLEMERHLRRALEHGEFRVFYQPQINLDSGRIVAAEALLRWQRTGVGLVAPELFMPLAEETGLIIPIGEWLLREACAQCRSWQQRGWKDLRIAVNLSVHQFKQADLTAMVAGILKETGLEPGFLDLELAENIAMHSVEASLKTLTTLKQSGVRISINDFGAGYSSLRYLKQFPIDRLKIDRSFIFDLASDPNNAAIIAAIIAMAHSLGLEVIAAGVETDEQLKFLKMHGCNGVQGYLPGYPVPADEFTELLRGRNDSVTAH